MLKADRVHSTPPTNTSAINPSRRGFLAQAAVAAAGGAAAGMALPLPVSAGALERVPDPILAAIERHKAAYVAHCAAVERHSVLENELPRELRQSLITVWDTEIIETDDPRWIQSERDTMACMDAADDIACELVSLEPTTIGGVIALLQYADDFEARGDEWPDHLVDPETDKPGHWRRFLCRNVTAALRVLA